MVVFQLATLRPRRGAKKKSDVKGKLCILYYILELAAPGKMVESSPIRVAQSEEFDKDLEL